MHELFARLQATLYSETPDYASFLSQSRSAFSDLQGVELARTRALLRLARALQGFEDRRAGTADIAVLLRQVIRSYHSRILLPSRLWQIIASRDAEMGLRQVDLEADGMVAVGANEWRPDWLPGAGSIDHLAVRRHDKPVIGDGMVLAMNDWKTYNSQSQKAAVSACLFAQPGSTTLISLPTGGGKSLCALLPAWIESSGGQIPGGTTLVVVPTVALAIDQEAHARRYFAQSVSPEYAPHSLTGDTSPDTRATIRAGLRNGTIPLLYIAPESLLNSFYDICLEAARAGTLHRLVIDEAHLVETWGAGFRTEFQLLSSYRKKLVAASAGQLRTVLLSATISDESDQLLRQLFGSKGVPFTRLQADRLRPEISYWVNIADTKEIREQRVIDALRHLPRPAILYVTRPEDAENWLKLLMAQGFERIAAFSGETHADERLRLLKEWGEDQRDIMVATSAFGLGVDKPDVRTVIHACLPENIARFYQEVGRSGRDGCSAISLVCTVDKDEEIALGMNSSARITTERALLRWEGMRKSSRFKQDRGDLIQINVDSIPLSEPEMRQNQMNRQWNEHIVLLMQRAKVISIIDTRPDAGDTEAAEQELALTALLHLSVLKPEVVNDPTEFKRVIGAVREKELSAVKRNFHDLLKLIRYYANPSAERCIASALAEAYPDVAKACGGCPACRRLGRAPYAEPLPLIADIKFQPVRDRGLRDELAPLMGSYQSLQVLWDGDRDVLGGPALEDLLVALVRQGMNHLVMPPSLVQDEQAATLLKKLALNPERPHILIPTSWLLTRKGYPLLDLPLVAVYPPDDESADALYKILRSRLSSHVPVVHIAHRATYLKSEHGKLADRLNGTSYTVESLQALISPQQDDIFY